MVGKKKPAKKAVTKSVKKENVEEEELDDNLGGEITIRFSDEEVAPKVEPTSDEVTVTASKPVTQVKKGDRVTVDGKAYIVDSHYVLIDHGSTKEMALELYDANDKDYQLRYFNDQVETTMEFYELQEILYVKKHVKEISW